MTGSQGMVGGRSGVDGGGLVLVDEGGCGGGVVGGDGVAVVELVAGSVGGGGALARIEKGRKVMRERKSEWSQTDELPVSAELSSLLFHAVIQTSSTDRNTSACGKSISFYIRLPCLKGAVN